MKVIKKFWVPIFIVSFLLLGYVIGQVRNSIKVAQEPVSELLVEDKSNEWNAFNLVFENSNDTTDNPWGFTAGLIDVDEKQCVFLNPNTAVVIYPKESSGASYTYSFDMYIHPWVADASDGAGVVIMYLDKNDGIMGQEEVGVGANGENVKLTLDSTHFQGTDHFKILCNNGGGDDSGDWVVIDAE